MGSRGSERYRWPADASDGSRERRYIPTERSITADLHLGHTNIFTYSGRPFRDAEEMDASMVERWNGG
jgi:hypothetical protein